MKLLSETKNIFLHGIDADEQLFIIVSFGGSPVAPRGLLGIEIIAL